MTTTTHGSIFTATALKRVLLLLLLLCVCYTSFSQESQPPRKPFVLRSIDWGYRIIEGDSANPRKRYVFPFPIIAYRPESRWILGVSVTQIFRATKHDSITRPSFIRMNVSYSQERQFAIRPQLDYFSRGNKINIRGLYNYTDFGEYYWGIGPDAPEANKEAYAFNMHRVNVKAAYRFLPGLYAGLQYSAENMYNVKYGAGSQLETSSVAGHNGYFASGVGFTLYFDNREHVYFPFRGHMIELSNVFYNKAFGSGYTFNSITLEARKYVGLWRENVLAFHGIMNLNYGDVPFRMMGVIGNESYMRGYYSGRYRDNDAMAVQAELRKTIWGPVGCVIFAGCGAVNSSVGGLSRDLKPTVGAGLRVKAIPKQRVNVRIDYGIGSGGNRALYITMNEAF